MADRRIRLVIVSPHRELRQAVLAQADPTYFATVECASFEDIPLPPPTDDTPSVVVLADRVRAAKPADVAFASDVMHAPTLFTSPAGDAAAGETLAAIGIQDVLALDELTPLRLRDAAFASLARESRLRELERERARAVLRQDISAAMAAATTALDTVQTLLDGLIALGADAATCWTLDRRRLSVLAARTPRTDDAPLLSLDAAHPVAEAAARDERVFLPSVAAAKVRFGDLPSHRDDAALLAMPLDCGPWRCVFEVRLDAGLKKTELGVFEQTVRHAAEAIRRSLTHEHLSAQQEAVTQLLAAMKERLCDPLVSIAVSAADLAGEASATPTADPRGDWVDLAPKIAAIAAASHRLREDLQAFSASEDEARDRIATPVDLVAVLERVVGTVRARGDEAGVVVSTDAPSILVPLDEPRIERALGDLLTGARRWAHAHSPLEVRVTADDHAAYLDIEAPGPVVAHDRIVGAFRPFDAERAPAPGLFVAARVVETHGGRVWAEPRETGGVRLCVQLPRSAARPEGVARRAHGAMASASSRRSFPLDPQLEAIAEAFRAPQMREFLDVWLEARGNDELPHPDRLRRARLVGMMPHIVESRVETSANGQPVFRWTVLGPRLERRLRGTLEGGLGPGNPSFMRAQYEVYRMCYQSRRPVYDYLRHRSGDGLSLERLLLPLSRTGGSNVTDIIGLALFD